MTDQQQTEKPSEQNWTMFEYSKRGVRHVSVLKNGVQVADIPYVDAARILACHKDEAHV